MWICDKCGRTYLGENMIVYADKTQICLTCDKEIRSFHYKDMGKVDEL